MKRGKISDRLGTKVEMKSNSLITSLEPPTKEILENLSDQLMKLRKSDKRTRNELRNKENDLTRLRKEKNQLEREREPLKKKVNDIKHTRMSLLSITSG